MMKLLRSPVWQFIGVFVAVLIGLAFYFKDPHVKRFRVDILSNSPLVSVNTDVRNDLEVRYKGKPVQTLSLILLKFANTGTEPIGENDYSEPIRVSLSRSAEVGEVVVQATRPAGIQLAPTVVAGNQVQLAKVLLNPGDEAVLKILALNNDTTLGISARIVGVRGLEIQSVLGRNETTRGDVLTWFLLIAVAVLLFLAVAIWHSRPVIEWRRTQFGFNPARHYYTRAQVAMLAVQAAKDTSGSIAQVIYNLDRAFSWDTSYVERAKVDTLFSQLHGYEPFKELLEKYKHVERPKTAS